MKVTPQCPSGRMSMRCSHALAWGAVVSHPGSLRTVTTHLGVGVGTCLVSLTPGSSEVTESCQGKWVWGRGSSCFLSFAVDEFSVNNRVNNSVFTRRFHPQFHTMGTFQKTHQPILVLLCHYGESELWHWDPYMNTHISQHTLGVTLAYCKSLYF